jgi:Rap1a immunity proteins
MKRKLSFFLVTLTFLMASVAGAAQPEDFKVQTAKALMDLCTTAPDSPIYKEAIHFCHGFLVGAYAYHVAETSGPEGKPLVCLPDPAPTRSQAINMFMDWLKAHPQFLNDKPVEAQFRFLIEKWPCKP